MKKVMQLMLAILVLGISHANIAQTKAEKKEEKALRKEERKLQKAERINESLRMSKENFEKYLSNIKDSTFVIETHTLFDRRGNSLPVSPTVNFVMVVGNEFTMQIGFNGRIGANGLGGTTLEGYITDYQMLATKNKESHVRLRLSVNTLRIGQSTVTIDVNRDGYARAYVSGAFRTRLSFAGNIAPLEESIVHKGLVTY